LQGRIMLLSDVMAIVFSVLGVLLAFQGLWLLSCSIWPAAVLSAAQDCERALWKPFLVGLPVTAIFVFGVGALSKIGGPGGLVAVALLSLFVLTSSVGVAGLCSLMGRRLNSGQASVKTMILGGVALELAYVFPLVGWFVVLPISLVIGCGATVRYLLVGRKNVSMCRNDKASFDKGSCVPAGGSPLGIADESTAAGSVK
jgi:hypothetical protein